MSAVEQSTEPTAHVDTPIVTKQASHSDSRAFGARAGSGTKRKKRNPLVRFALMVIRRSHLYFGLLLAPWALLYGVTAYLFNHPTHFSESRNDVLPAFEGPTAWPTSHWEAESRAASVVAELNRRFSGSGDSQIELLDSPLPEFSESQTSVSFDDETMSHFVFVPLDGSEGTIRVFPKRKEKPKEDAAEFQVTPSNQPPGQGSQRRERRNDASKRSRQEKEGPDESQDERGDAETLSSSPIDDQQSPLLLEESLQERLVDVLTKQLASRYPNVDLNSETIRFRSAPKLKFHVRSEGREWICEHDAISGAVSTRRANANSEPDWRRFLLRLHVAHGYPSEGGVRWYWAIIVDVMAGVMIFWGISGIVMWWQIKSTRRWGTFAMAVSLVMAVVLGVAMFQMLHSA